ncbi:MAG: hypothetical protein ACYDH8_12670 [Syntrophales bacterium]
MASSVIFFHLVMRISTFAANGQLFRAAPFSGGKGGVTFLPGKNLLQEIGGSGNGIGSYFSFFLGDHVKQAIQLLEPKQKNASIKIT